MGKIKINERQYQKLISYIRENQGLDPKSKAIVDDIISTLNEGDSTGLINKIKSYAAKGLMTSTIIAALMGSPLLSSAQKSEIKQTIGQSQTATPKAETPDTVSTVKMNEWNKYITWLKSKGLSGDKRMDNIDFSKQTLVDYKKENPAVSLTYEDVPMIQKAIIKYREYVLKSFEDNRAKPSNGIKPDKSNFMSWALKTGVDGIIGQYTSQFIFPEVYLKDLNSGNVTNLGFADPSLGNTEKLVQQMGNTSIQK